MKVTYFDLFKTFFRVGGFTIGGGYVMLPMLQKEVVDVKGWVSDEDMVNYYALAQSIPGAIAINTSTMVGYQLKGLRGAFCSTAGMVTPSLLIIMLIASFFGRIHDNAIVASVFNGVRVAVFAIMVMAVIRIGKKVIKSIWGILLAIGAFTLVAYLKISPFYVILGSIILGIIMSVVARKDVIDEEREDV